MSAFIDRSRLFEEYLRDGISAAKNGQRKLAVSLLERALSLNPSDARACLWLSATTDDPQEQHAWLEKAVVADPTNAAARRGLALLNGKIDRSKVMPEGAGLAPDRSKTPADLDVTGNAFLCPKCGGRMAYSVQKESLCCEYCAYSEAAPQTNFRAETTEQVMDYYMHTAKGHGWAAAQQQLKCERCGALNVLPPGQRAAECSYCGSNQLVQSPEQADLIEPQAIAVVTLDETTATDIARRWLGKGLFAPDSLAQSGSSVRLRSAYYSCWTFDGTVEARWTCEVAEGDGNSKRWLPINGVEGRFFNDVLVSGIKALPTRELERLEPFNLHDLQEFKPDYLAGWPAILYDCSLSDASLIGREKALHTLRPELYSTVAMGQEKRNVNISAGGWSGMTFKHILVPLWIGTYRHAGQEYRLLINGQTGKVSGQKPRDNFKAFMAVGIVFMLLVLALLAYWALTAGAGPV